MLKKFWLYLSLVILLVTNNVFAQNISDAEAESVDSQTRAFLYDNEPELVPEGDPGQDLCDPNNPSSDNCNLFQIQDGKPQSAFQKPVATDKSP